MKRFQFPLERVRRWRAGQAALEELKLEQLRGNLQACGKKSGTSKPSVAASEREVLGQASIEASELESLDAYRLHARNKIREYRKSGSGKRRRKLRSSASGVIEARRNAELLERLKRKSSGGMAGRERPGTRKFRGGAVPGDAGRDAGRARVSET